jgi:hypothetical protein
MIEQAWEEQKAIKDVMVFLQGVGVSTSLAVRIYKTYREEAIKVLADRGMVGQNHHPGHPSTDPGGPPVGDRADPCLGQPVRRAALVHRTAPAGRRVLAGVGQRHPRLRPAPPSRLELLPLGAPSPSPPMSTCRRRRLMCRGVDDVGIGGDAVA